jgi:hypothetical protein
VETQQSGEPPAVAAAAAVRAGDVATLTRLLAEHPDLATARLGGDGAGTPSRTLLHVAADWPGHYPNGTATVAALAAAGADVNAPFVGRHTETPLHWAASSDDVDVLDALLDAGANIDAPGGSVGDGSGTALFDATVFGQWRAARRLVERGATAGPWEAAALGLLDRLTERFDDEPWPTQADVTAWFWAACHGGQRATAELLLDRGADLNWVADWDGLTPLDAARRSDTEGRQGAAEVVSWLQSLGARSAGEPR